VRTPALILALALTGCSAQAQAIQTISAATTEVERNGQEQDRQGRTEAVPGEADTPAGDAPQGREAAVHLAGPSELEALVRAAFPEDPETAVRIVTCESRWDPAARSQTSDTGLFQINDIHRSSRGVAAGMSIEDLQDPITNIRVARLLYDESGWRPWVCY